MIQILLVLAFVAAFVAVALQLVRVLRSDGYGKLPPPRSHHDEAREAHGFRSVV